MSNGEWFYYIKIPLPIYTAAGKDRERFIAFCRSYMKHNYPNSEGVSVNHKTGLIKAKSKRGQPG